MRETEVAAQAVPTTIPAHTIIAIKIHKHRTGECCIDVMFQLESRDPGRRNMSLQGRPPTSTAQRMKQHTSTVASYSHYPV